MNDSYREFLVRLRAAVQRAVNASRRWWLRVFVCSRKGHVWPAIQEYMWLICCERCEAVLDINMVEHVNCRCAVEPVERAHAS